MHYITLNPTLPEVLRDNIEEINALCASCRTRMWITERKISLSVSTPKFQMCCVERQAILKPLPAITEVFIISIKRNVPQE